MRTRRKMLMMLVLAAVAVVSSGCPLLAAAGLGGAGAAVYFGGRVQQTVGVAVPKAYLATITAFKKEGLPFYERRADMATAHVESAYADGKRVWVDMERLSENRTKVTVRVGVVPDKGRAFELMEAIQAELRGSPPDLHSEDVGLLSG